MEFLFRDKFYCYILVNFFRNQLKTHIVMSQETGEGQFMDLIEQVMGSDRLLSSTDVCKMVDSISKDDVVAVSSLYFKKLIHVLTLFSVTIPKSEPVT